MPKNRAGEQKKSKCTQEPTFSKNCRFFRSNRKIVQLQMEKKMYCRKFLFNYYKLIFSPIHLELHITGEQIS